MKKLMTTLALAALFSIGAAAQTTAPAQEAPPKELAAMQGTWMLISVNDQALADQGVEMALTFTGNKYSQIVNGAINETGTFKIDPAKKPMSLDLNILEGDDAGKLQLGIVEITGDTMKVMFAEPGSTARPTDFMSGAAITFVAKKVK